MSTHGRSNRKEVSFPASISAGGRTFRDVVTNVSETGLFLSGEEHRLRPGERVRLSFSLPVGERLVPVEVDGRIARIVRDSTNRAKGLGIQFQNPRPTVLSTLRAYVAERDRLRALATSGGGPALPSPGEAQAPPQMPVEAPDASDPGFDVLPTPTAAPQRPAASGAFLAEAPDLDDEAEPTDPEVARPGGFREIPDDDEEL